MQEQKLPQFTIRGAATTRLETFIDAAFAFAITMLVISVGTIPKNYPELILAVKNVPSFALSFAGITWFWLGHRQWSRWFGLEDRKSIILTLILIFVMLVYVYPLRLIFSAMLSWMSANYFPSEFVISEIFELTDLFVFYGIGFFALCGTEAMLYRHAYSKRQQLQLNAYEQIRTQSEIYQWSVASLTGLSSAMFALLMPINMGVFSGFFYSTLAISMPFVSIFFWKKLKKL
ncbi:MAG: DUF1211 domain-containing protein [Bacteroidales bacterium]|nr:DUF1211 domain-containing protein [Bacteroidales bacterium]